MVKVFLLIWEYVFLVFVSDFEVNVIGFFVLLFMICESVLLSLYGEVL